MLHVAEIVEFILKYLTWDKALSFEDISGVLRCVSFGIAGFRDNPILPCSQKKQELGKILPIPTNVFSRLICPDLVLRLFYSAPGNVI